ncbi:MAG TPA: septum formation initiator [Pseudonocardiaceae bacterium]|jgi:hypothetical protein|nr:septum formation initiator [Pseudonocardiaceae bacterium]
MTAPARRTAPPRTAPKTTKAAPRTGKDHEGTTTRKTTTRSAAARGAVKAAPQPERTEAAKARSAAAERAYARRAQRTERTMVGPKPERKPGSASRVTFVVLVMGLLIVGVVASLWFSTQATADAYSLEQAKAKTQALSQQVQLLQQQVAQADSAPSLAARARALGMVPAGDPAHLVVGTNGAVTVIGQPAAATPTTPAPPQVTAPTGSAVTPPSTGSASSATPGR